MGKVKRPNRVDQARLLKGWEKAPIGTDVLVTKDNGEGFLTKTRSAPFMLGGHTACVMVEGISGAYPLERIRHVEL